MATQTLSTDDLEAHGHRSSSTSQDSLPDVQHSTPALDPSSTDAAQSLSHQSIQASSSTPTQRKALPMCGPVVDSSPLSSPASLLDTRRGASCPEETLRLPEKLDPAVYASTTPNGSHSPAVAASPHATKTTAIDGTKVPSAPASPGSTQSITPDLRKKRAHIELDEPSPSPRTKRRARQPVPATTRPSRDRKAPERFTDQQELSAKKPVPPRKSAGRAFDPGHITTHANSRLKKTDVYHMLVKDEPWSCLTVEQKQTLLSLLPKTPSNERLSNEIGAGTAAETARPIEFSQNFNLFRTDVAKFKEDLESGYFGKRWQEQAEQAVSNRFEGNFDDWKEDEAQSWWGQK